ncbi:MAG: OsmC family protein [Candidatus Helarchaeota archaeon]
MAKEEKIYKTAVNIEWTKELLLKLNFEDPNLPEMIIDENPESETYQSKGPNAAKLLLSAIMGCLNASFIFCLQKSRVPLKALTARAIASIKRNEEGFLRISQIDVEIIPSIEIEKGIPRMERCIEKFHNYCTITESVRHGIPVSVVINQDKIKKG